MERGKEGEEEKKGKGEQGSGRRTRAAHLQRGRRYHLPRVRTVRSDMICRLGAPPNHPWWSDIGAGWREKGGNVRFLRLAGPVPRQRRVAAVMEALVQAAAAATSASSALGTTSRGTAQRQDSRNVAI